MSPPRTLVPSTPAGIEKPAEHLAYLRTVFASLHDAAVLTSFPGRALVDVNPATERMFGRSRESLVGQETTVLHVDEGHEADFATLIQPPLEQGRSVRVEWPFRRANGETFQADVTVSPLAAYEGDPIRVIYLVRDLTQARAIREELHTQRERFGTLVDLMPQMAWSCDKEGHTTWLNRRWADYTGRPLEEFKGYGWLKVLHPADVERVRLAWEAAVRDEAPYEVLYRVRDSAGDYRWHLTRAAPLRDGEGRILEWFGTCTDIHEEKQTEEELTQARSQLMQSEKMSALGSLISGVAHEIRTPLTYLTTSLHLLDSQLGRTLAELPPEQAAVISERLRPQVRMSIDASDRINRLVEDLRRYSRSRFGKPELASLSEVVKEAVDLFRATHRGDVRIDAKLGPTPERPIDRIQIQQVVLNLLNNALDARPRDGTVHVRTTSSPTGQLMLEIEDQGHGIPTDVQSRMWEPFYTTKEEGTGLGLSVVRRIVEAHGGHIACASEPGRGTTFRIHLP